MQDRQGVIDKLNELSKPVVYTEKVVRAVYE